MKLKISISIIVTILLLVVAYFAFKPKAASSGVENDHDHHTANSNSDYVPGEVIHPESHHQDSENKIAMRSNGFEPSTLTVEKGTTVIFRNDEIRDRWPASDPHSTHDMYPEFDPKAPIKSADQWLFTFDKVGEWKFHDHLYPEFQGTIKVVEVGELPAGPSVFHLEIKERKFTSTLSTLHVYQGDIVEIHVLSDEQEEFYLRGYDERVALQADQTSTLKFTANVPGKFSFELLKSGVEIGSLIVESK
jgi:plastocyanin